MIKKSEKIFDFLPTFGGFKLSIHAFLLHRRFVVVFI